MRSLFGKAEDGGIERFDLVASIYYQNRGGLGYPPPVDNNSSSTDRSRSGSSTRPDTPWERIFSEVVMKDLDVSTSSRKVVVTATLSHQIRYSHPASSVPLPVSDTHSACSAHPLSLRGRSSVSYLLSKKERESKSSVSLLLSFSVGRRGGMKEGRSLPRLGYDVVYLDMWY